MKLEHRTIIAKAMSFLVKHLVVDVSLMSEIESQKILDSQSVEEILVGIQQ